MTTSGVTSYHGELHIEEMNITLSDLRIVLLGWRWAGKSSAGNTVLGTEHFKSRIRTAKCMMGEGDIAGRRVTVVDTPGWWWNMSVKSTPEMDKQEIARSVSLVPSGPSALLLVINADASVTEAHRRSVMEHLELLGEGVWRHTIVLFTHGDRLENTTVHQHIETEEKALQWIVEKCGNRYHVLNNENSGDGTQVTELLEKIETMVAGNGGRCYEINHMLLREMGKKRQMVEERWKWRRLEVQKQRTALRTLKAKPHRLSELSVVLLGSRESGKSSAGNTILGRKQFASGIKTVQCVKRYGTVSGRQVTVIDTPGWWRTISVRYTPEMDKQEIVRSVSLCLPGPSAIFLVISVDSSFTEAHMSAVKEHLELLSERVWRHTIVLFTNGDWLGDAAIEEHVETEGKALQWIVEKCGNRYHLLNNDNSSDGTQVAELLEKIEEMLAGNGGCHFEFNKMLSQDLEEKRREVQEKAKQRMVKVQTQRKTLRELFKGELKRQCQLRVVLLGGRWTGKSSAGNTILRSKKFESGVITARCVKRQDKVAGRKVTVVDTPGWWRKISVQETPELDKEEIMRSVSLCPPGPYAFFLVLSVTSSFTDSDRRTVEEHMDLLSERIWRHTIVLFTWGDWLGEITIEQHIESEGKALRWLVEKCGNRYHVLSNEDRGNASQVTELLEKVDEMVAVNSGFYYDVNKLLSVELEEKKREVEERAKERLEKVKKQKKTLRELYQGEAHSLSQLRIVLLGWRGSGKSSAGNTILGKEEFDVKRRTAECVGNASEVAGRQVTVVDTPGWWRDTSVKNTPERDKQEIVRSVSLCPPGPGAIFLVVRVDESFTETDKRSVEEHLELLTESVWRHTAVLFTCGDWLGDTTIEQRIEAEGKALQWLVDKCGNRYHVLDNKNWVDGTQVKELLEKVEEMVAGNNGGHFEISAILVKNVEEKRKSTQERVKQRMTKVEKHRKALRTLFKREDLCHFELSIVLLGWRLTGKSSVGNTILGREEFESGLRTVQCVKGQGEVAGRQVLVVDTPGWSGYNKSTSEVDKQEIMQSLSLCLPRPSALFLVISVDESFPETYRRSVEEHLEFLGERVWRHTIVLFTNGDWLGDTAIEQHIESEGKALQWIVEKCGNRYHVLNNRNKGDRTPVTELLEKVEEMVARNRGGHLSSNVREEGCKEWFKGMKLSEKDLRRIEEEWNRREEELIERMSKILVESETERTTLPARKWGIGVEFDPPSMIGGTPDCSEDGGLAWDCRLTNKRPHKKATWRTIKKTPECSGSMIKKTQECSGSMIKKTPECSGSGTWSSDVSQMDVSGRMDLQEEIKEEANPLAELRIVLLGGRASGKSTAGNTVLRREAFESGTGTLWCVKRQGEVAGRQVTVVDTPGWLGNMSVKDTAELDKQEIVRSVSLCPPGPCALFLLVNVDESFTEIDRKSVEEHLELLGKKAWRHTIVLFSKKEWLGDTTIEQHIETEGKALQWLVEKCGNRYHVLDNKNWVDGTQVIELLEKVEAMVAGNRGCHLSVNLREEGWKQWFRGMKLTEKDLKEKVEEEWKRREGELIERMLKVLVDSEETDRKGSERKGGVAMEEK